MTLKQAKSVAADAVADATITTTTNNARLASTAASSAAAASSSSSSSATSAFELVLVDVEDGQRKQPSITTPSFQNPPHSPVFFSTMDGVSSFYFLGYSAPTPLPLTFLSLQQSWGYCISCGHIEVLWRLQFPTTMIIIIVIRKAVMNNTMTTTIIMNCTHNLLKHFPVQSTMTMRMSWTRERTIRTKNVSRTMVIIIL
jgi:hypothetical protein